MSTATEPTGKVGDAFRHVHHRGPWFEFLTEPESVRVEYIRRDKPEHEVETRLRLMQPVTGTLPDGVIEAGRALSEARRAYGEAYPRRVGKAKAIEANRAWTKALVKHKPELDAMHWEECGQFGCPWTPESPTIFPEPEQETPA